MKILLIGAGAAFACGFLVPRALENPGPLAGPAVETAAPGAPSAAPAPYPPAQRVAVASIRRDEPKEGVPDPVRADVARRPFDELDGSVRGFVVRAVADLHGAASAAVLAKVKAQGVHARNAADFSAAVAQMQAQLRVARAQYLETIENVKLRYRSTADSAHYRRFTSDRALRAELAREDGLHRIVDEGEEERADGTPGHRRAVVVVRIDDHPELRDARDYLEGFETWRQHLRHDARSLLLGLRD